MGQMHELLSVESDAQGQFKLITAETEKVFKEKASLFQGFHRTLVMFDDNDKAGAPDEHQALTSTVQQRLDYTAKTIIKYFDVLLQKELTNQKAVADIIVDGITIAEKVPATFLLGMESKLKEVRNVYANIPTLQVGVEWAPAEELGQGVFKMVHPEEKLKTEMKYKSQVIVAPTEHHPAQVEKWQEQVPVGKFVKNVWSGMLTSAEKHKLLEKIDKLISAVKKARQRANTQEVVNEKIGNKLMDFIHS